MAFFIENGVWSKVFAVPCDIVDNHIKLCSPLSLKVLMVMLRHGSETDIDRLAEILGQSRTDVQDAVNYWIACGIIHNDDTVAIPAAKAAKPVIQAAEAPKNIPEQPVTIKHLRPNLNTAQINDMAENDDSIGHLLQEAQQVIGKPLTPVATEVIATLYAYYGMKPDLILMLIQYCLSIGKDSMRYIEKVAISWIEKGIDTHEKAETEILRLTSQNQTEGKIRSLFGINDRSLASSEKKYINTWVNEWALDFAVIEIAYERCIELKGNRNFAYINGILTNWYQKNIKTPAQAMQEIGKGKEPRHENKGKSNASYDMSELEMMIASGPGLEN